MKFGIYGSGSATRILKFLSSGYSTVSNISVIIYDGTKENIILELQEACIKSGIIFEHASYHSSVMGPRDQGIIVSGIIMKYLDNSTCKMFFCFGDKILSEELIDIYPDTIINFHPSVLPAFKGLRSIDKAIEYGALILGNTAHFVDKGIDTGAIIMQSFFPSADYKTYDDVLDLQLPMLHQIIKWILSGRMTIEDRKVFIKDAQYRLNSYLPNIEP